MINKLHPLTITSKLSETASFYKDYFDFTEAFTSDWYVQLAHENGAEIALMLPELENQPEFLRREYSGHGVVLTFETEDAAAVYETLKQKGIKFTSELKDEEWGQRHFIATDPAGVYVDVVQYL